MTRVETLKTLLEREQADRDVVRVAWETAQRQALEARDQAGQLANYRSDYRAKWTQRFTQHHSIEILRHYQSYVARLDQAVAQQELAATRAEGQQRATLVRLRESETRVASVQKLIERRLAAERLAADRRDQKSVDEAANRAGAHRLSGFGFVATTA